MVSGHASTTRLHGISLRDNQQSRHNCRLTRRPTATGLATSHNNHGLALTKLAGPNIITTPLSEASLFLPAATTSTTKSNAEEVSPNGWGDLLKMMKDATSTTADEHQAFARNISKNVVVPLKKLVSRARRNHSDVHCAR